MTKIIQWNLNGFFKKQEELKLIIQNHDPQIICLQETNFRDNFTAHLKNYVGFSKNRILSNRASGGVTIYTKSNIPSKKIKINSNFETIAVSIELNEKFSICNIYLPNQTDFSLPDLENIIRQLPKPFILVGDFNSHNIIWGSNSTNSRGKTLEKLIQNEDLVLLNDSTPTHINFGNGNFSCIDLSLSSPSIAQRLEWEVLPEIHSSDHIPIKIIISHRQVNNKHPNKHRWNLKNPNWNLYTDLLEEETNKIVDHNIIDIEETTLTFTNLIINTANMTIGSTNQTNKPRVPWWNEKIKEAISNKNKALTNFKKNKTSENLIELKRLRAKSKFLIKNSKKESWNIYTSTINGKTSPSQVWRKIKSLKGLSRHNDIVIKANQSTITDQTVVADTIGIFFHENFSDKLYEEKFINEIKIPNEFSQIKSSVEPNNPDQINLNLKITMDELEQSMRLCNSKSPGPDTIPYSFLHNMGSSSKQHLLNIYNHIWKKGQIPVKWKMANIIPISKPGIDKHSPEGYRPISLLNTMAKILEKIVNTRLIWFLEKEKILSDLQSGFRKHRSTIDSLTIIKSEVNDALNSNQYLGLISIDIAKAYDSVWRHRLLHILSKILTNGNMFNYIKCYLNSRQFSISLSNAQSKNYSQQNGIPQGSSLSVTLFLLAINDITNTITFPVKANLFADDFNFWCKSPNLKTVQHFLQETANNIAKWSTLTGFKISCLKSQCIIFSNKRGQKHINIQLNDILIPNVNTIKILGVYFDKKINWLQHLKQLKISLSRNLNIMKMISHTTWGGDEETLIKIHRHLIRAKMDYGATIFQSAKSHHKRIIDSTINSSLRFAIGAFRSSPIESIRNLALEPPTELRHLEKSLLYAASITRNSGNPANKCITEITEYAKDHGIEFNAITKVQPPKFPPWAFNIDINLDLTKFKKELTPPIIYKNHLNEILKDHKNANYYYTDASKSKQGVGIAITNLDLSIRFKLPESCSIYTAEAIAILKTVDHILLNHDHGNPHKSNLILSDSLSSLTSLKNPFNTSDIAKLILQKTSLAYQTGIKISLVWIPGHCNIEGNEKADQEAKKAAEHTDIPILNITTFADIKN